MQAVGAKAPSGGLLEDCACACRETQKERVHLRSSGNVHLHEKTSAAVRVVGMAGRGPHSGRKALSGSHCLTGLRRVIERLYILGYSYIITITLSILWQVPCS